MKDELLNIIYREIFSDLPSPYKSSINYKSAKDNLKWDFQIIEKVIEIEIRIIKDPGTMPRPKAHVIIPQLLFSVFIINDQLRVEIWRHDITDQDRGLTKTFDIDIDLADPKNDILTLRSKFKKLLIFYDKLGGRIISYGDRNEIKEILT